MFNMFNMFKKLKNFYKNKIMFFKHYFNPDIYYIDKYLKSNDINGFAIKDPVNKIIVFIINELIVDDELIGYYVDIHKNIYSSSYNPRNVSIDQLLHNDIIDCFKNPETLFSSCYLYNVYERHNINRFFINVSKYDKNNFKEKIIKRFYNNCITPLSDIGLHPRNGYSFYTKNGKSYHKTNFKYDNVPDELTIRDNGKTLKVYQTYRYSGFIIKRVFEINGANIKLLSERYNDNKIVIITKNDSINHYNNRLQLTFAKQFGTWSEFHSNFFLENELEKLEYKERYAKANITFL